MVQAQVFADVVGVDVEVIDYQRDGQCVCEQEVSVPFVELAICKSVS